MPWSNRCLFVEKLIYVKAGLDFTGSIREERKALAVVDVPQHFHMPFNEGRPIGKTGTTDSFPATFSQASKKSAGLQECRKMLGAHVPRNEYPYLPGQLSYNSCKILAFHMPCLDTHWLQRCETVLGHERPLRGRPPQGRRASTRASSTIPSWDIFMVRQPLLTTVHRPRGAG